MNKFELFYHIMRSIQLWKVSKFKFRFFLNTVYCKLNHIPLLILTRTSELWNINLSDSDNSLASNPPWPIYFTHCGSGSKIIFAPQNYLNGHNICLPIDVGLNNILWYWFLKNFQYNMLKGSKEGYIMKAL